MTNNINIWFDQTNNNITLYQNKKNNYDVWIDQNSNNIMISYVGP